MAAYTELKSALYNTISYMFPTNQTIWMYGGGTEPTDPYVGLHILDMDQIGREQVSSLASETSPDSDSFFLNVTVNYEAQVQITFKGSTAGDMAHEFSQKLNNPIYLERMRGNNLGRMRMSSIRNAPQLRETKYVPTFIQTVTFSYAYRSQQSVDYIKQVLIENETTGDRYEIPKSIG
jgi:hypothetical protein